MLAEIDRALSAKPGRLSLLEELDQGLCLARGFLLEPGLTAVVLFVVVFCCWGAASFLQIGCDVAFEEFTVGIGVKQRTHTHAHAANKSNNNNKGKWDRGITARAPFNL